MNRTFLSLTLGLLLCLVCFNAAHAEMLTKRVDYKVDGTSMRGYLAYDDTQVSADDPAPGVLVIPEWWGLNAYPKMRARQLAEMGYVAFCADMYGQGKTTDDPKQAGQWSSQVYNQGRSLARARANKALDVLRSQQQVNGEKLGAIGFCFGGTTVMELAYSGAEVDGVVSFHGHPKVPKDEDLPNIHASVLILHGDADPTISRQKLIQVTDALDKAKVDWHLVRYARAKHAFSNPKADSYDMAPIGYNEAAAKRSWAHMRMFFNRLFHRESK